MQRAIRRSRIKDWNLSVSPLRIVVLALIVLAPAHSAQAQSVNTALFAVDTASPQATIRSFFALRAALETTFERYRTERSSIRLTEVHRSLSRLYQLLDLSLVPPSARRKIGTDTIAHLLDVINRIEIPPVDAIPSAVAYPDATKPGTWTIPGTEIRLNRVLQGERAGEFLFSPDTIFRADEFYAAVRDLPLRHLSSVVSWRDAQLQSAGFMIPDALIEFLPPAFKKIAFSNPIWKLAATALLLVLLAVGCLIGYLAAGRHQERQGPAAYIRRMVGPVLLLVAVVVVRFIIVEQVNLIGAAARYVEFTTTIALYSITAWLLWLAGFVLAELIIVSPSIPNDALDRNLLRLLAQLLGSLGIAMVAAYGAQQLGFPIFGVLAGLGVGGIAVALAAQSSIENLIGGLNLYADRPIRVGDYCTSPHFEGFVEHIGLRSTRIRGLDRTLTTIPNSNVAKATLVNLSCRDQMLFRHTLDITYAANVEQLRGLVTKVQEFLQAHRSVRSDFRPPRTHVVLFSEWSIKVEVVAYLDTQQIAEFLTLQEELLLHIMETVQSAGVALAIPSQANYIVDCRPSAALD
ncbi:MAG TPA: mechanosensitive ion channel domain-containing protein [Hyphomicrobiaceae bacterium]|nr:mechanosensitive ion channel domain-containing protein [Hyphomicrobiaceae bacterium]